MRFFSLLNWDISVSIAVMFIFKSVIKGSLKGFSRLIDVSVELTILVVYGKKILQTL